jgi:hypothetical protein
MVCYVFCSINTVYYMAPFATMILALPAMVLEGGGVINWFYTHDPVVPALIIILGSGVLAFCLNFSIFYVIHSTTAVTFNVAGNLKVRQLYSGLPSSPCPLRSLNQHAFVGCGGSTGVVVDLPEPNLCNECNWMWNHSGWLHFLWLCEASDLATAGCCPWELAENSDGDASPCGRQARKGLARWRFRSGRGTIQAVGMPREDWQW